MVQIYRRFPRGLYSRKAFQNLETDCNLDSGLLLSLNRLQYFRYFLADGPSLQLGSADLLKIISSDLLHSLKMNSVN